jgi:hypothetical protein
VASIPKGVPPVPPAFARRLRAARSAAALVNAVRLIAPPPVHTRDQYRAATKEAHTGAARLGPALSWPPAPDGGRVHDGELSARVLVALTGCRTVCPHLKRTPLQPAVASLALRRVDCLARCVSTVRRPPPEDADVCGWCGVGEVSRLSPTAIAYGALLVSGPACPSCAGVLTPDGTT